MFGRKPKLADFNGHRVVVNTKDDQSIRGVLQVGADCLILHAPEWISEAGTVPIPKQSVIPLSNYSHMQVLEVGHAND